MTEPLLLLELNELSPVLLDRFIDAGELPNLGRLRDCSAVFRTDAAETGERLNPWVQWVTVHTGVGVDEHGVAKLGQAANVRVPTVADQVMAEGLPVWLCGSMNVVPQNRVRGAWLPDPWSPMARAQPEALEEFALFVRAHVQEHTNRDAPNEPLAYVRFARFMVTHGLSTGSVAAASSQVIGERAGRRTRHGRAVLLDRFQWDVFRWYYRRVRPAFSTFFSNSTAHLQHLFWEDMEPERFGQAARPPASANADAIRDGYRAHDELVGRVLDWAAGSVQVAMCTALSQDANTEGLPSYEGFHRPRDLDALAAKLSLAGVTGASPVMAEQFRLFFIDAAAASAAAAHLSTLRVSGVPAFESRNEGRSLLVGSLFFHPVAPNERFEGTDLRFHDLLYWAASPRSGEHHPIGALWLPAERPTRDDEPVPLTAVAPTLTRLVGGTPAPSMKTPPIELEARSGNRRAGGRTSVNSSRRATR